MTAHTRLGTECIKEKYAHDHCSPRGVVPRPQPCHKSVEQPRQPVRLPALVSVLLRKLALHPLFLTAVQTPCICQKCKVVVTPTKPPWGQAAPLNYCIDSSD